MTATPARKNLRIVTAALGALVLSLTSMPPAQAQATDAYPSRAITLIVPFPAGSGTDMGARLLAKDMAEALHQSVVVENRPGADGSLGTMAVARARPDGYTLLVGGAATHAANYAFYPGKLQYQPASFDIVGGLGLVPVSMFVAAGAPWKSAADLIADARRQPGEYVCGSGTPVAQMACELFKLRAGIQLVNAPYKGSPQALGDLAGGHVHIVFADGSSAAAHVEQKRLRVLATAAAKRLPYWPDVPTFIELGMQDFEMSAWSAVFVPAGTPAAIQQKLNAAVRHATQSPEALASRQRVGSLPLLLTQEEGKRFIASEIERWARLVKESGIRLE